MYAWVYIVFAVVVGFFLYVIKRSCSFFTHNQLTFIGILNQSYHIYYLIIHSISGMYEKAEEDAIESQLQERATIFAQELVKVSSDLHKRVQDLVTWWILWILISFLKEFLSKKRSKKEWDIISMLKSKRMEVKPEKGESFLKGTVWKAEIQIQFYFFIFNFSRSTFHLFSASWMGNTESIGRSNKNFCFWFYWWLKYFRCLINPIFSTDWHYKKIEYQ